MGSEDQDLILHSKKRRRDFHHPKGKHFHQKDNTKRSNIDLSKLRCYTCDERGNFSKDCPVEKKIALTRRRETREDIMLMLQKVMNLPQRESSKKVMILQVMKNMS